MSLETKLLLRERVIKIFLTMSTLLQESSAVSLFFLFIIKPITLIHLSKETLHTREVFLLPVSTWDLSPILKYLCDKLKMSCIYPNLQSFIHLKQWDVVYTQDSEGKSSREGERKERNVWIDSISLRWKMWEIFWAPGVFGWANVLFEKGVLVAKPDVMIY